MRIGADIANNSFIVFNRSRVASNEASRKKFEGYYFHHKQRDNRRRQITLRISEDRYVLVVLHYKDELCLWGRVQIFFCDGLGKCYLYTDNNWVVGAIRIFAEKIKAVLLYDLELYRSINNLGFSWNKFLYEQSTVAGKSHEGSIDWPGLKNLLWSTSWGQETWLYSKAGRIFLENTLTCDRIFFDPPYTCSSFEACIATSKSVIVELDCAILERWLVPLQETLSDIEKRCRKCREVFQKDPPASNVEMWAGGFLVPWDRLTDFQRISAICNGLATNRGKILR